MHELRSDGIDGDSREKKHDELTRRRKSQVAHCQFDLDRQAALQLAFMAQMMALVSSLPIAVLECTRNLCGLACL